MAKKVACWDLGNVIVNFKEEEMRRELREDKFALFLENILAHDRGQTDVFDIHREMIKYKYFKNDIPVEQFAAIYNSCLASINLPVFEILMEFKEKNRGRLVCITDNNYFCIYATLLKFPAIWKIFRENGRDQWIMSHKLGALKREINPYIRAFSEFGFSPKEAVMIDDFQCNLTGAAAAGFKKNACLHYDRTNPKINKDLSKFLDKHFPAK